MTESSPKVLVANQVGFDECNESNYGLANSERIEVLYKQASLKSTGQDVADCIGDVYTNHGWVSVWTWVQSAFIPETVVAIAAACVGANL